MWFMVYSMVYRLHRLRRRTCTWFLSDGIVCMLLLSQLAIWYLCWYFCLTGIPRNESGYADELVFVNLSQTRVICKEGTLIGETQPPDWTVGKSIWHFLNCCLELEGPSHGGSAILGMWSWKEWEKKLNMIPEVCQ